MVKSDFSITGRAALMLKDLELIHDLARHVGAPMPVHGGRDRIVPQDDRRRPRRSRQYRDDQFLSYQEGLIRESAVDGPILR